MNKRIYTFLMVIFIAVGIGAAGYIIRYAFQYFNNQNINENAVSLYRDIDRQPEPSEIPEEPAQPADLRAQGWTEYKPGSHMAPGLMATGSIIPTPAEAPDYSERELLLLAEKEGKETFKPLLDINSDFIGMLLIEGLGVELPFVQGTDNEKYLTVNFEGEESTYGTVFLSSGNDRLLTDHNIVIFGHHTNTDSMFTPLVRYRDINTVAKAPVIVLDSLVSRSIWLVFAGYVCEPDYGYIDTSLTGLAFEELLTEIHDRSIFHTNVDVNASDQILTLSTCTYEFQDARFVVHARKLREGETVPALVAEKNASMKQANVPNQHKLADVAMEGAAVLRHPRTQKNYYYRRTDGGLEYFIGNTSLIQGGYGCFEGNIPAGSAVSAAYLSASRVALAAERLNGENGIYLMLGSTVTGPFQLARNYPVTPSGADARFPLLAVNGSELWMAYTVTDETYERLFLSAVYADGTFEEPDCVYVALKGTGLRPAGMIFDENRCQLTWLEQNGAGENAGLVQSAWLTGEWKNYYREVAAGTAPLDFAPKPETAAQAGDTDRVTIYGGLLNDGAMRMITERGGRLVPDVFTPVG